MEGIVSRKLAGLRPYDPDISPCPIRLDANESFLELPERVKAAIADRISKISYNRYPDPLAARVCEAFGLRYGISARYVTAGNGSDELISVILNAFVQKGEKVLITEPDFSMYRFYCDMDEIEPVIVRKGGDLCFDADEMIERVNREKARLIIFSNPCNPTGQGIAAEEALRIVNETGCVVVIDEAYMDFWDQSLIRFAPLSERLIVLRTCSKIGFAAARLGFAVSNAELTDYIRAAKSPYNVNALTQAAGEILLSDPDCLNQAIEAIKVSRGRLYEALKRLETKLPEKIRVYESHTNFVTISLREAPAVHRALKEAGISVRLISSRFLRVTAGTAEENGAFCRALEKILFAE